MDKEKMLAELEQEVEEIERQLEIINKRIDEDKQYVSDITLIMRNEAVRKLEHVKAKIHYVKEMVI
jgi:hypothetical protein